MTANAAQQRARDTRTTTDSRSDAVNGSPDRYRLVHESRAEWVLPLPSTIPDAVELLDAVRSALHAEGRPVTDATVHQGEGGELIVSYQVATDHDTAAVPDQRRKAGAQ